MRISDWSSDVCSSDLVMLIDLTAEPIETLEAHAIRTTAGHYPVDVIVLATGFEALISALLAIDIRGVGGRALRDEWIQEPKSYLGLGVAGFPHTFQLNGPVQPPTPCNALRSGEEHGATRVGKEGGKK